MNIISSTFKLGSDINEMSIFENLLKVESKNDLKI